MKTIYKKTIIEKMNDEIIQAKANNKVIEKFILTEKEFNEYKTLAEKMLKDSGMYYELGEPNPPNMYNGVEIEIETLKYLNAIKKNKPDGMMFRESFPQGYK